MTRQILTIAALAALAVVPPVAAQQRPQVAEPVKIASRALGEERTLLIRTPAGYESGAHRYPVLYMTDGDGHMNHTAATIEFLARNGRMPEMIVVGITNTDRTRDLTPTRASLDVGGQPRDFPTAGGADNFLKFIETEVVPYVERTYRTEPFRILAGHSFGGLFALHAFYSRPDLFQAVIAVSPTLMWDDDLPVRRAKEFLAGRPSLDRTLFVTMGAEGPLMQSAFDDLRRVLEKSRPEGFAWDTTQFEDEDHGSVVMRSHYHGLRKVFDGWQLPIDTSTGVYTGSIGDVRAHYQKLSGRLGYSVTPPEATVNRLGYSAMARGRTAEALEFFEFNVRAYPDSANVYDSLGEGLEAAGRLEDALTHYEKAVSMGEKTGDPLLDAFREHVVAARGKLGKRPPSQQP